MSYTRDSELDLVYNSETDSYEPAVQEYVLTINPTPSDATVVLTATGFEQEGNSITVNSGTTVSYVISKTGYKTVSDEITVTEDQTLAISLIVDNNIHIQHLRGTTSQINNYTGKEGEITYDTITHTLRVHDGIKKGGYEISGSSSSNYHPDLFDYKWADHELNDVQWLRADTFSWQSADVYQAAYQHLVDDYNNTGEHLYGWSTDTFSKTPYPSVGDVLYRSDGTEWSTVAYVAKDYSYIIRSDGVAQLNRNTSIDTVLYETHTETIAGVTITYYQASDGHKLVLPDQESNVQAIYAATGVAWYYIIDTTNQRFKLPRAKHNKYTESLSVVGNGMALGLTSNGSNMYALGGLGTAGLGGYFQTFSNNTTLGSTSGAATRDTGSLGVSKDSTLSGLTTTSMEQETDQYKYLYFYVGQFTQTALENTAGITTETLNDKLDLNLGNAPSDTKIALLSMLFPDYTKGINISNGATSSVYGWFYIAGHGYSGTSTVSLNGNVVYTGADHSNERLSNTCILLVKPNDVISWSGWQGGISTAKIYPCNI